MSEKVKQHFFDLFKILVVWILFILITLGAIWEFTTIEGEWSFFIIFLALMFEVLLSIFGGALFYGIYQALIHKKEEVFGIGTKNYLYFGFTGIFFIFLNYLVGLWYGWCWINDILPNNLKWIFIHTQ